MEQINIYLTIALSAILGALFCILKRIDDRIDELEILVRAINDWVYHHNKLNKTLLKKAQELDYSPEPLKPEISD